MSASVNDYFQKLGGASALVNTPKVTAARSPGGTSLTVDNCNWDTTTGKRFATFQVDTSGDVVDGTEIIWKGIVTGSTSIGSLARVAGATDTGNAIGDYVMLLPASDWANQLVAGLLVQHNQDGTHGDITANSLSTDTINEHTSATGVTVDGLNIKDSKLNTDGSVIPSNLLAGTGSTWVAQSWTPTVAGLTIGNGTVTAKYTQIGKKVFCSLEIVWGSTTSQSGTITFTLPVTASANYTVGRHSLGNVMAWDNSATAMTVCLAVLTSTTVVTPRVTNGDGATVYSLTTSNVTATSPFTWATSDALTADFVYEAA